MIALLLLWAVLLPVLVTVGRLGLRAVGAAPAADALDAAFEAFWLGLVVAAGALLLVGLLMPVDAWALLALLLAAVVAMPGVGAPLRLAELRWGDALPLAAAAMLAAWLAAGRVVYFDTAYYHLQAVRMMGAFGVVQGAHLVAEVYGSVSSWFALAAPFNGGSLAGYGTGTLNGLATAMAMAQALVAFRRMLQGRGTAADAAVGIGLAFAVGLVLRWHMVAAATPDLPLLYLPPVLGWMLMRRRGRDLAPVLLAAGAAAIKLSAAPLVLIALLWAVRDASQRRSRMAACVAVGLPFAVATVGGFFLATGCLVFPLAATCFDVAWGMPADQVSAFAARVATGAGTGGSAHAAAMGIEGPLDRLRFWMHRDTSSAALAVLFALAVMPLLPLLRRPAMDGLRWPLLLALTGAAYVAATAPVGRFAGGYVALALGVLGGCLWRCAAAQRALQALSVTMRAAVGGAMLGLAVAAFGLLRLSAPLAGEAARVEAAIVEGRLPSTGSAFRLLLPLPVVPYVLNEARPALPATYRTVMRDGVSYALPEGDGACWAHDPPCGVAARLADPGKGLRGGLVRPGR